MNPLYKNKLNKEKLLKLRKVFIKNLPKKYGVGANKNKLVIDWENCINQIVSFIYDDIQGTVEIVDHQKINNQQYLYIKYLNKNQFKIHTNSFIKCCFGALLKCYHAYKYQVGDIIKTNSGYIEILKQIRMKHGKYTQKGYIYQCLNCGNIDAITNTHLQTKCGCNVCAGKKVLKGYNDMWTINPSLAKLLANPEDGYKYTQYCNKSIDWRCPDCGNIIENKKINNINKNGLSCPKCSDGISYPEKFMFNVLEQLNINFIYQYSPEWIKPKRYDFYFKLNNKEYIIEMDGGLGHGKKDNKMSGQTKEESKAIDDYKDKNANEHNIEVIRIDCYYNKNDRFEYIKNNILNSNKLNNFFHLSKIDWLACHEFSCSSRVKEACDLWNNHTYNTTTEIANVLRLERSTICRYLKQGNNLNWCNYNPKEEAKNVNIRNSKNNSKETICLNTKDIFTSTKKASEKYNTPRNSICLCCRGEIQSAGKHPITGENFKMDVL